MLVPQHIVIDSQSILNVCLFVLQTFYLIFPLIIPSNLMQMLVSVLDLFAIVTETIVAMIIITVHYCGVIGVLIVLLDIPVRIVTSWRFSRIVRLHKLVVSTCTVVMG